jgi:hypothetical protein
MARFARIKGLRIDCGRLQAPAVAPAQLHASVTRIERPSLTLLRASWGESARAVASAPPLRPSIIRDDLALLRHKH